MQFRIFTEPQQGATYDDLLAMARLSEELGFDAFFRSDHYQSMGEVSGLPGPTDAWITLAGLARETTSIRLGTLVTSATFRYPGPLAISVAQVDQMSGGRVELGLGAGWYEIEHTSYAIDFPPVSERFDRLEDQLAIVTGLWRADGPFTHRGHHHQVIDSPGLPKPVQRGGPPIIIGGRGKQRTPALAARYGAEFNFAFGSLRQFTRQRERVRAACEAIGRDPDSIVQSAALAICCGADDAEVARRAAAIGRDPDELRANHFAGSPSEIVDQVAAWCEAGAQRIYFQVLDLHDHDHLRQIAAEVVGPLRHVV